MYSSGQLTKDITNGAGTAVGQALSAKLLETLLGDTKIGSSAQNAVLSMQQHFLSDNAPQDWITPLLRKGFFVGKEPFKKAESIAYLGRKIGLNHRRLQTLTNMNLQEAATLIWDLHCQIALHIMHRLDDHFERSDVDHSYVLMYLQESISAAFEEICNKPDLTDKGVLELKAKIATGITTPFHTYVQSTQASQSKGARRTALEHNINETMERVAIAFDRFTIEKPLRTSIDSIQQTAQTFYQVLKKMLLSIVLIPRSDAEKQQDLTWVSSREILLTKAVQNNYETMVSYLQQHEFTSPGYEGNEGTLYKNPFADRVLNLMSNASSTQDGLYFSYIMSAFANESKLYNEVSELEHEQAAKAFNTTYGTLNHSATFLLKDILHQHDSELKFINTALLLYKQAHELARFMSVLQHFMQLVGKLGLYNNPSLHKQLNNLIQAVSTTFEQNSTEIQKYVRQRSKARVGGWLNPIGDMLLQLKQYGNSMTQELQSFKGHFSRIIDPFAMQQEFNKSKIELLQAALGLGHASQIEKSQMDAIVTQIGSVSFDHFIAPTSTSSERVDVHARLMEIIGFAETMRQRLDATESSVTEIKTQYDTALKELQRVKEDMIERETSLRSESEHLKLHTAKLRQDVQTAETRLSEIDHAVEKFGEQIKQQLRSLDADNMKDIETANQLIEAATQSLLSSSSQNLSHQMTLLSQLKGHLEERQKSYQRLVTIVAAFQTEYALKSGSVAHALHSVQAVAKDIDRTVLELITKINALSSIISKLHQTLEEKDKQLAVQQKDIAELRAELAEFKSGNNSFFNPPTRSVMRETNDISLTHSDESSQLSTLSLLQSRDQHPPLLPINRIRRAMEVYDQDILHGTFVRNKPRKMIKFLIWSELNEIIFNKAPIQKNCNDTRSLILAAIQHLRNKNPSLESKKITYFFNDITKGKTDMDIYLEFLKGKDSSSALHDLKLCFLQYFEQQKNASIHGLV